MQFKKKQKEITGVGKTSDDREESGQKKRAQKSQRPGVNEIMDTEERASLRAEDLSRRNQPVG